MDAADVDAAGGGAFAARFAFCLATVGVAVEMREVAARDVQPQAVAFFEQVAGGERLDHDFYHFAGLQQFRLCPAVAVAAADDAVGDVHRVSPAGSLRWAGKRPPVWR